MDFPASIPANGGLKDDRTWLTICRQRVSPERIDIHPLLESIFERHLPSVRRRALLSYCSEVGEAARQWSDIGDGRRCLDNSIDWLSTKCLPERCLALQCDRRTVRPMNLDLNRHPQERTNHVLCPSTSVQPFVGDPLIFMNPACHG